MARPTFPRSQVSDLLTRAGIGPTPNTDAK